MKNGVPSAEGTATNTGPQTESTSQTAEAAPQTPQAVKPEVAPTADTVTPTDTVPVRQAQKRGPTMELYNKLETKKESQAITNSEDGQARCVPHFIPGTRGQVNGFRCFQVNNSATLAQAGIQEGDVILRVDMHRLVSSDDVAITFNLLQTKQYSEIYILRDGREEVLRR